MTILNFISIVGTDFQNESRTDVNPALSQLSARSSILPGRVNLAVLNEVLFDKTDGTLGAWALG